MAVVNHDYPLTDEMTVVNDVNEPIEDVTVRIYDHTAFFAGEVDTWVAETLTDADGKWIDPVELPDGQSWVVHFQKEGAYGPDHVEITT